MEVLGHVKFGVVTYLEHGGSLQEVIYTATTRGVRGAKDL